MSIASTIGTAALALAGRGWPVLPIKPQGKEPLTRNGVKDATTDTATIEKWFGRWPDANLGVATGAPGPTVLDVDDPAKAGTILSLDGVADAPSVATARGRHVYFRGLDRTTIVLGYGELRGRGSYVVAPPSLHPSGVEYTWLLAPTGPLPEVPADLPGARTGAGAGARPPRARVPHGERHAYLRDHAVRLVRAGITDAEAIERAIASEYDAVCDKDPPPKRGAFARIARWAADSEIAQRENERGPSRGPLPHAAPPPARAVPSRDAPLNEIRAYIAGSMGLPTEVRVTDVTRAGADSLDRVVIDLSNGMRVTFRHQGDVTVPRLWQSVIALATNGIAKPGYLKAAELGNVLWALCVVSNATTEEREEDELRDFIETFVGLCARFEGHTFEQHGRFELLEALQAHPLYDPSNSMEARRPVLVADVVTDREYVRAGELVAFADHTRLGVSRAAFPGRMRIVGLERVLMQAWDRSDRQRSRRLKGLFYAFPEGTDHE